MRARAAQQRHEHQGRAEADPEAERGEVRHAEQFGNQLYVLDEQNFLSSLNLNSGRIMWSVQVTGAESTPNFIHTFEMRRGQGLAAKVTPMVLVGLGSELLKFDGTNGAMTKQRLAEIAARMESEGSVDGTGF